MHLWRRETWKNSVQDYCAGTDGEKALSSRREAMSDEDTGIQDVQAQCNAVDIVNWSLGKCPSSLAERVDLGAGSPETLEPWLRSVPISSLVHSSLQKTVNKLGKRMVLSFVRLHCSLNA